MPRGTGSKSAAQLGDTDAMNVLGTFYNTGMGVPRDYQMARNWYQQAAQLGNAQAMANLGLLFEFGFGVPQNYSEAWRLYDQAAAEGNAFAIMHLGQMAEYGKGMAVDLKQARDLYLKAANLGDADASWRLALLFDHHAADKNPAQLAKMMLTAAKAGSSEAREALLGTGEPPISREVCAAIESQLASEGAYSGAIRGRFDRVVREALATYLRGGAQPVGAAATAP